MSSRWMIVATGLWLAAACASRSGSTAGDAAVPGVTMGSDVITAAELGEAKTSNLYDYIRAHRPRWLERERPTSSVDQNTGLVVYVDNTRIGDAESLRHMTPGGAILVRYLSPSEAHAEYGPGHLNGVIQVRTR
jgi:hypothetical protein